MSVNSLCTTLKHLAPFSVHYQLKPKKLKDMLDAGLLEFTLTNFASNSDTTWDNGAVIDMIIDQFGLFNKPKVTLKKLSKRYACSIERIYEVTKAALTVVISYTNVMLTKNTTLGSNFITVDNNTYVVDNCYRLRRSIRLKRRKLPGGETELNVEFSKHLTAGELVCVAGILHDKLNYLSVYLDDNPSVVFNISVSDLIYEIPKLVIGGFCEFPDGRIASVIGWNSLEQSYQCRFENGQSIIVSKFDRHFIKSRADLFYFPDAKDPHLPYEFDMMYGIKNLSDLKAEINRGIHKDDLLIMARHHNIKIT